MILANQTVDGLCTCMPDEWAVIFCWIFHKRIMHAYMAQANWNDWHEITKKTCTHLRSLKQCFAQNMGSILFWPAKKHLRKCWTQLFLLCEYKFMCYSPVWTYVNLSSGTYWKIVELLKYLPKLQNTFRYEMKHFCILPILWMNVKNLPYKCMVTSLPHTWCEAVMSNQLHHPPRSWGQW